MSKPQQYAPAVRDRSCSYCAGTGWGESDYDPGTYYPCHTCNPGATGRPTPSYDLRHLDGLVAARVLGWKSPRHVDPYRRGQRAWIRPKPKDASSRNACYVDLPEFSDDFGAAASVMEALVARGYSVNLMSGTPSGWQCTVILASGRCFSVCHSSAAQAICRAALDAVDERPAFEEPT